MEQIPFNIPALTGREAGYIEQAMAERNFSGDGCFTRKCEAWLEETTGCYKALLTTSGTHALELAALLCNIGPGDEVIMPSYTFTSTANAFVLRGARIVFVDICPDTMNINEELIKAAITHNTKAIAPVHYGGTACRMDYIMEIAERNRLLVVEDAAQGVYGFFQGRALGGIGDLGAYSFHESKNCHCGEGGAILIHDKRWAERAEIIREKGTDRSRFFRGQVDKYSWQDIGSSYIPSEINAAFLFAQLEALKEITQQRICNWDLYYHLLSPLSDNELLELPVVPEDCRHNGHIFYIKTKDEAERSRLSKYLKERGINAVFHYIPLHSSRAGQLYGRFHGEDIHTSRESARILRLPLYYGLSEDKVARVADTIYEFFGIRRHI